MNKKTDRKPGSFLQNKKNTINKKTNTVPIASIKKEADKEPVVTEIAVQLKEEVLPTNQAEIKCEECIEDTENKINESISDDLKNVLADNEVQKQLDCVNDAIKEIEEDAIADMSLFDDNLEDFYDKTVHLVENKHKTHKRESINTSMLDKIEFKDDKNSLETKEKNTTIISDPSSVYVKTMLDLFENMSLKVNQLIKTKTFEQKLIEECYKFAIAGEHSKIEETIDAYVQPNQKNTLLIQHIANDVPRELVHVCTMQKEMAKKVHEAEHACKLIIRNSDRIERENTNLVASIEQIKADCEKTCSNLIGEKTKFKDNLINLIKEHKDIDNMLEMNVVDSFKEIIGNKEKEIEDRKRETTKQKQTIAKLEQFTKENDPSELHRTIGELNKNIKKLQQENLEISQNNNKLTEKNFRFQKDLVMFSTEIKKLIASDKIKTETILRQKKLIEMFQEKLTSNTQLYGTKGENTIRALKSRRDEIKERIKREVNLHRKEQLEKEQADCERRLSDLLKRVH